MCKNFQLKNERTEQTQKNENQKYYFAKKAIFCLLHVGRLNMTEATVFGNSIALSS